MGLVVMSHCHMTTSRNGNLSNKAPAPTSRPGKEHVLVSSTDCGWLVSTCMVIFPYYSCIPPLRKPSIVVPFSPYRTFYPLG